MGRSGWTVSLCVAVACLGAAGCTKKKAVKRQYLAACTEAAECETGECYLGACTKTCTYASECGDTAFCVESKCVQPERVDCTAAVDCRTKLGLGACHEPACTGGKCGVASLAGKACDDGSACTSGETCTGGACGGGTTKTCDDGNPCTTDACEGKQGCTATPTATACDDGNPCTVGDACGGGSCKPGAAKDCADADPCTADTCDGKTGQCNHAPLPPWASCGQGSVCMPSLAADPDLVGLWAFDKCDSSDSSGRQNHATFFGKIACAAGPRGDALVLDGTDGYAQVVKSKTIDVSGPAISYGGWIRSDGTGDYTIAMGKEQAWELGWIEAKAASAIATGKPNNWKWKFSAPLVPGSWHHVVVVYDGKVVRHYVGGKLAWSHPLAGNVAVSDCDLGLGARGLGCTPVNSFWKGGLDDLFVFRRALQPAEVSALANPVAATVAPGWLGGCLPLPAACANANDCSDGDPCTADACDGKGTCAHTPGGDGAECEDGDPCTVGDTCKGGQCAKSAKAPCEDGNACTIDACDAGGKGCSNTATEAACDDGNACSVGDKCTGGSCKAGAATDCSDGDVCTTDACDAKTGACGHTALPPLASCGQGGVCVPKLSADADLVGLWRFDKCEPADSSDKGNHAKFVGNAGCTAGPHGDALLLDGLGGYARVSKSATIDVSGPAISYGGWIRSDGTGDYTVAMAKEQAWELGWIEAKAASAIAPGKPNNWKWQFAAPLVPGQWRHVAVVYDGKVVRHYVDGKVAWSYPLAGKVAVSPCDLGLGARGVGCGADNSFWKGGLDDLFVFRRVLQPAEVLALADPATATVAAAWNGVCQPVPACTAASDCNDGDPCTADTCDGKGACVHIPGGDAAQCEDGDPCTLGDACKAGQCAKTGNAQCDDGNPCTTDTCEAASGVCAWQSLADGAPCGAGKTCEKGVCPN